MDYEKLYEKFCNAYEPHKEIISAVYEQLGCCDAEEFFSTMKDVMAPGSCGANAGFTGFTWYDDTKKFWFLNRSEIKALMQEAVDGGIGYDSVFEMVSYFTSVKGSYTDDEIGMALFDSNEHIELVTLYDILSKYALEEIAFWATDFIWEHDNECD